MRTSTGIISGMTERAAPSEQGSANEAREWLEERLRPETMGQLGGQLAHDFNNILAVTLTSVEVAMRVGDSAKANGLLSNAIEVIKRGRTLTNHLAAASQACETQTQVDVHALILAITQELERACGHRVRVLAQLDAGRHLVSIDEKFLARAVRNVVINAHEAMKNGGEMTLSTRNASGAELRADKSLQYVVIAVKDTGSGMSDEIRHRAFDLFYTTKSAEPWRGTGLAQVKDALRRVGGSASIESELGTGTTVTLAIPLA